MHWVMTTLLTFQKFSKSMKALVLAVSEHKNGELCNHTHDTAIGILGQAC